MATTTANYQNLTIDWNVQDSPAVISDLIKSTGLLQTAYVDKANWGNKHKYKRFNSLPSGTFRTFGEGIVPVSFSKDMESLDLWEVSTLMQVDCGEAEAHPGGVQGWYTENYPAALTGLGHSIAKQCFYGTELQTGTTYYASQNGFLGLAQYNLINGTFTEIDTNDTNTGAQNSIHVVRWERDTGASLRVYPNANGELITTEFLGKALVVTSTTTNAQQPVYSWIIKAYMTLVVPSATSSFMVCGFSDNGTPELPTAPQLSHAIDVVAQGGAGDIRMYCNLKGMEAIRALKYAKVQIDNANTGVNNNVLSWDGVPVHLDTNLVSTEYAALYV